MRSYGRSRLKPYSDSSKANAVVHGVSQRSHSLDNFILCERILCDLEKFAVCTALINRISLVARHEYVAASIDDCARFFCRPAIVAWRIARFCRSTEHRARYGIDTEPNRCQIFSISLFYCFPINQFRCSSNTAEKKKPNELLSHQAKCVLMTSAHIQFAKKPKGSFRRFIRWHWSWTTSTDEWMTWGPNPCAAHMYSKW